MSNFNFGRLSDYKEQRQRIREWALRLRQLRPSIKTTWTEPADWVVKEANIHGQPVRSLTITLTPTGCQWASTGGCTMCGEYEGSTKNEIVSAEFHIAQFASAASKYISEYNPAWIRIYQEGNYANPQEIENSAQFTILRLASLIGGVQRISIESMAKYLLKREVVQELRKSVARGVELEIGIGFEGENDVVRNVCINKGESISDFRKAVSLLREFGVRSLAYIVLKPPFLSEGEAIEEAIETIQLANEIGFDAISLEPLSIHKYTLVHALHLEGLYQLPWLWSVVKVARSAQNIKDFRIGGVGFYPRPIDVSSNRHPDGNDNCNEQLWRSIKEYGKFRKLDVFRDIKCDCQKTWESICQTTEVDLKTRIDQQLDRLDIGRYKQSIIVESPFQEHVVSYTTAATGGTQYPFSRPDEETDNTGK